MRHKQTNVGQVTGNHYLNPKGETMGEIADMMIDGLLDCETGEYIDGDAPGFPRTKRRSTRHNGWAHDDYPCPYCERVFKSEQGVQDHVLAEHSKPER